MKYNPGSSGLLCLIYFSLFMGKVENHEKMFRREDKVVVYLLLFIFLAKKELQSKYGLASPELSKIWVNTFKCKSTLFTMTNWMKMKLHQYFYERKILDITTPSRSKSYF